MNELWQTIQPILMTALAAVLIQLIRAVQKWAEGKISDDRHRKAEGIALDAVFAAAFKIANRLPAMLADGKLDDAEKAELKAEAVKIAKERLKDLRGFAIEKLDTWTERQVEISLGKLLAGSNPQADGPKGLDSPATE